MKAGDYVVIGKRLNKAYQETTEKGAWNIEDRVIVGDIGKLVEVENHEIHGDLMPYLVYFPRIEYDLLMTTYQRTEPIREDTIWRTNTHNHE